MRRFGLLVRWALLGVQCSAATPAVAEDWPNWRGPQGHGVAAAADYPIEWGPKKNVAWKVVLPGRGSSTPIVSGEHLVLTCPNEGQNEVICLDRSGSKQWSQTVGAERGGKHRKASGTNPSPVTDGDHVFAYFKSGDLACLDWSGEIVWHVNLQDLYGEDTLWWDLGTSPVLTRDSVVVAVQQSGPSYIVALDKATGEEMWRVDRTFDVPDENDNSYTTPCVVDRGESQMIIVAGADHVTAHGANDGGEIWRIAIHEGNNGYQRSISSPVAGGNTVYVPYNRGGSLTAIRIDGHGDVGDSHLAWRITNASADVPTPAYRDGELFICGDRGKVYCVRAADGEVVWETQLPKSRQAYSSSPIVGGSHLYVTREDGTTFVINLAGEHEVVATNDVGESTVATPVLVDGRVLLRTAEHLWCFGES